MILKSGARFSGKIERSLGRVIEATHLVGEPPQPRLTETQLNWLTNVRSRPKRK